MWIWVFGIVYIRAGVVWCTIHVDLLFDMVYIWTCVCMVYLWTVVVWNITQYLLFSTFYSFFLSYSFFSFTNPSFLLCIFLYSVLVKGFRLRWLSPCSSPVFVPVFSSSDCLLAHLSFCVLSDESEGGGEDVFANLQPSSPLPNLDNLLWEQKQRHGMVGYKMMCVPVTCFSPPLHQLALSIDLVLPQH